MLVPRKAVVEAARCSHNANRSRLICQLRGLYQHTYRTGRHVSAARISRDSLRYFKSLVGFHQQTQTSELPDDELAFLQRRPQAARVVVDPV